MMIDAFILMYAGDLSYRVPRSKLVRYELIIIFETKTLIDIGAYARRNIWVFGDLGFIVTYHSWITKRILV